MVFDEYTYNILNCYLLIVTVSLSAEQPISSLPSLQSSSPSHFQSLLIHSSLLLHLNSSFPHLNAERETKPGKTRAFSTGASHLFAI